MGKQTENEVDSKKRRHLFSLPSMRSPCVFYAILSVVSSVVRRLSKMVISQPRELRAYCRKSVQK